MTHLILSECGLSESQHQRFYVVGAEDVPGMEAVTYGDEVDTKKLEPGIV
jgi:hypothetical protein